MEGEKVGRGVKERSLGEVNGKRRSTKVNVSQAKK